MRKRICITVLLAMLLISAACSDGGGALISGSGEAPPATGSASLSAEESPEQAAREEGHTRSFSGVEGLRITGYLQHIEIKPSDSGEVVLHWIGDGTETVRAEDGMVELSFPEPDWLAPSPGGNTPRFHVVSTIYVELPDTLDNLEFYSTLGSITIDGISSYGCLTAKTVGGDLITSGLTGVVHATSLEGEIGPDHLAPQITRRAYSETHQSRHLSTTLPGAADPDQTAYLETVLGSVTIGD